MPSNASLKAMNRVHRLMLGISGGRLGWQFSGMPAIELTTTGRKTGERRTTFLASPTQLPGGKYVIVASRGGDPIHPGWFFNLQANPNVEVRTRTGTVPMTAHVATPEERAELWPDLTNRHPNFAGYQRKTEREIPLVILSPA